MTDKRFIESATQNVDDGKINHYIYDMGNRKYLKMSDEKTTKNLCDLLNELHEENQQVKQTLQKYYNTYTNLAVELREDKWGNGTCHSIMEVLLEIADDLDIKLEDLE